MTTFALRLCATLVLGFALAGAAPLSAAPAATATVEKTAEAKKPRPIPFRGKITAINKSAQTLTVGKRVFLVTGETKIFKAGNVPARLEEGQVNTEVTGSYFKLDDGRLVARSVYFGGKGDSKTTAKPAKTGQDGE